MAGRIKISIGDHDDLKLTASLEGDGSVKLGSEARHAPMVVVVGTRIYLSCGHYPDKHFLIPEPGNDITTTIECDHGMEFLNWPVKIEHQV